MTETTTPKGVVAMIIIDGKVGPVATDFEQWTPGGFKLLESQKRRAMAEVGRKLIEKWGGPVISRLIDSDECKQIAYDIFCGRRPGFEYREEIIGHDV